MFCRKEDHDFIESCYNNFTVFNQDIKYFFLSLPLSLSPIAEEFLYLEILKYVPILRLFQECRGTGNLEIVDRRSILISKSFLISRQQSNLIRIKSFRNNL